MLKRKLIVVAYCRLSREDGDGESASIKNQKRMISKYAEQNGFEISEFYIDDGVSGYTMSRPSFDKLKEKLNKGEIDIILVKDLSRIGRRDAGVQTFIENIVEEGKRVIGVGDCFDTAIESCLETLGIFTWANEKVVRDTSKKVRGAIHTMQKDGKYISCVPYGYYIDPFQKGVYHVDETCAKYVQEMFEMYLSGLGINKIATDFTQRNIPTGSMITKQRMERLGKQYKGKAADKWAPNVILTMLKNSFYIGTLTLGKTRKRSIHGKKIKQDEENLHIFEDAHEPIIDKQTFKLVQQAILERSTTNYRGTKVQTRENIFTGSLYCADCGTRLTSVGNNKNTRYVCRTYNSYGTSMCTSHSVTESELKESLIYFLEHCRDNLGEAMKDLNSIIRQKSNKTSGNTIDVLEKDITRTESEIQTLMEQKMRETMKNPSMIQMIDDMYDKFLNEKYENLKSLKSQIQDHKKDMTNGSSVEEDLNTAMKVFNDIIKTSKITKRQIGTIVNKIVVHEDGGLDIFLKGNLHALCTNYIQLKNADKGKILEETIKYIEPTQDYIIPTKAWRYARNNGCHIGYENYFKIFSILIDKEYVVKNPGYNKGYRLNKSFKELEHDFANNNIDYDSPWCDNNNVTVEIIQDICEWVDSMKYKKNLF